MSEEVADSYNLDNMTSQPTDGQGQDTGQTKTDKQDSTGPTQPGRDDRRTPRRDQGRTTRDGTDGQNGPDDGHNDGRQADGWDGETLGVYLERLGE